MSLTVIVIEHSIEKFQKTFSEHGGRPAQELLATWRSCSADATTSHVRALEEGQRLPDLLASSICFPLVFTARSAEPQPSAIAGRAFALA